VPLPESEGSASRTSRIFAAALATAVCFAASAGQAFDWEPERALDADSLVSWRSDRQLLASGSGFPSARDVDSLRLSRLALAASSDIEPELTLWRQWLPFAASLTAFALVETLTDAPVVSRWSSVNSFDGSLRDDLRANTRSGRRAAETASDGLLYATIGVWVAERIYAGVQDVQYARQDDPDFGGWPAARMTGAALVEGIRTDLTWLLWSGVATRGTKAAAGRARPRTTDCLALMDGTDCGGSSGNESFFSGHASLAATMASLTCTRRVNRLDRTRLDIGICALSAAMAITTGWMRLVADEHWTTDVIMGQAIGALFGYVLPTYWPWGPHRRAEPQHLAARFRLRPIVSRDRYGVGLQLRF
jgi:membrane-associated phospholipid phosphatase